MANITGKHTTNKPVTAQEIQQGLDDPYAIGSDNRTGRNLYRVDVRLWGHAHAETIVHVWAESEEQARDQAEEWACENTLADDVNWDVDDSDVRLLLPGDPERLSFNPEFARAHGQLFLI
jgi:hypothetical protein